MTDDADARSTTCWRPSTRRWASRSTSSSTPRPRCSAAARPSSAASPTPTLPDLPGPAGRDAGRQRQGRRVGDPDRPRAQLRDRRVVPLRPEELLLPGHAEELPDLAVRRADRLRRLDGRRRSTATETFRVEIERAHMEEDTGKSLHVGGSTGRIHGADYSLVDYNRAGIPLIEIVTRPIMGAGEQAPEVAKAYVAQLRELIVALGVSEARMDQGNLRADVNLSLAPKGTGALGTRTETKNVNSFRSVERAVRYEMQRHAAILAGGGSILQETRHWHEDTGVTTSGREKSDADDYRYFPEPDLVPVAPSREWVEELRGTLPENPTAEAGPPPGRVGLLRPRDARHHRCRRLRAGRGDHRRRGHPAGGPQVVALRARPPRQRHRHRHRRPRRHPGRRRRRPGAHRRGQHQRQAGPPGLRGPVRRRGHPRGDRRGPRAGHRLRRRGPGRGRRQGDRRQPGRRRQDPRRQGRGRRRAHRMR